MIITTAATVHHHPVPGCSATLARVPLPIGRVSIWHTHTHICRRHLWTKKWITKSCCVMHKYILSIIISGIICRCVIFFSPRSLIRRLFLWSILEWFGRFALSFHGVRCVRRASVTVHSHLCDVWWTSFLAGVLCISLNLNAVQLKIFLVHAVDIDSEIMIEFWELLKYSISDQRWSCM